MIQIGLLCIGIVLIVAYCFVIHNLNQQVDNLKTVKDNLLQQINSDTDELNNLRNNLTNLNEQAESILEQVDDYQRDIERQTKEIQNQKETISANFSTINALRKEYDSLSQQIDNDLNNKKILAEKDFIDFQKQQQEDVDNFINLCNEKRQMVQASLDELQSKEAAAVAARTRAFQEEKEKLFYRLLVDESSLADDEELADFVRQHSNKPVLVAAIGKVRWAIIWSKAYTDLIGRLFDKDKPCGIYKITNVKNGMSYVGQAINVPERWAQHIKRALNAETRTNNKLYPAMAAEGLENFSFELIEKCDRSVLNEREDFWQDYFKAKEFGYSMR